MEFEAINILLELQQTPQRIKYVNNDINAWNETNIKKNQLFISNNLQPEKIKYKTRDKIKIIRRSLAVSPLREIKESIQQKELLPKQILKENIKEILKENFKQINSTNNEMQQNQCTLPPIKPKKSLKQDAKDNFLIKKKGITQCFSHRDNRENIIADSMRKILAKPIINLNIVILNDLQKQIKILQKSKSQKHIQLKDEKIFEHQRKIASKIL